MISKEDLSAWKEEIKGCKKLKGKNNFFVDKAKNLIEKSFKINKNNHIDQILPKKSKRNFFNFKLKKGISLGLDKQADKKLRAGKYPIDLRVDLHGLNLEDAYFKLKETIDYAFSKGYRLILAITGKGLHSIEGGETIKSSLENWLSQPEISSKIIKYVDAHKKHGGKGAVYVLLRKNNNL